MAPGRSVEYVARRENESSGGARLNLTSLSGSPFHELPGSRKVPQGG